MPIEYAGVHFLYGFYDGNNTTAVEQYPSSFLNYQILTTLKHSVTHTSDYQI